MVGRAGELVVEVTTSHNQTTLTSFSRSTHAHKHIHTQNTHLGPLGRIGGQYKLHTRRVNNGRLQ